MSFIHHTFTEQCHTTRDEVNDQDGFVPFLISVHSFQLTWRMMMGLVYLMFYGKLIYLSLLRYYTFILDLTLSSSSISTIF